MHKLCHACGATKPATDFARNARSNDGLQTYCRPCHNARVRAYAATEKGREAHLRAQRKYLASEAGREVTRVATAKWASSNKAHITAKTRRRELAKQQAVPSWADKEAIRAIYLERDRIAAATGVEHHVDHIVPLNGRTVCGLHCETNLRIIPSAENIAKLNRYWPDMP